MHKARSVSIEDVNQFNAPQTLWLTIASVAIAALLALTPQWQWLELRAFDWFSTLAPPRPAVPAAVVVAIDEPSFAELQKQWPWPRDWHAKLVRNLRAAGARTIVLDLVFAEPSGDSVADAALAAAMGPDVVLAGDEAEINDNYQKLTQRVEPFPGLLTNGTRYGIAQVLLDRDGVVRHIPLRDDMLAVVALRVFDPSATVKLPPQEALIQYFGPARTYPTFSYYQALDPSANLPPNVFKDKLVIVGFGQQAQANLNQQQPDSFATSFTARHGGLTFGAEIHATILDNLRHGLFVTPIPVSVSIVVSLLIAWAAGTAFGRFDPLRSIVCTAIGLALIVIATYVMLRQARYWLPLHVPMASLLLMAIGRTGLGYMQEQAQRRWIVNAFGHYLQPQMVERLVREPGLLRLGGEVRELSILFCDVRGFTTISENMQADPERLTRLVNRILTPLSECVLARDGSIDKYIGDCIMAFWNAPLDEPDHAFKAASTALDMVRAIARLNEELAAEGMPRIAIGVGVNSGRCVVGNMGSDLRFAYSALGDSVNLASRLESASKEFGVAIVLGPETARQVGDRLPLLELGAIHVKGKRESVQPFTIVREFPTAQAPDFIHLRHLHGKIVRQSSALPLLTLKHLTDQASALAPSMAGYYARICALAG